MSEGGLLEKNRVKTLTFNNGKEFAGHELTSQHLRLLGQVIWQLRAWLQCKFWRLAVPTRSEKQSTQHKER
jgi:hypothetical protein